MILTRSRAGLFPNRTGLPVHNGRSASTVFVSRPARASLVLRPADLLTHLSWAWLRGFDGIRYQVPSLVSYPGIPRTPGVGLSPTGVSRRKGARSVAKIYAGPDSLSGTMSGQPWLFKWRHVEAEIIVCAVRWYLRYRLSYGKSRNSWPSAASMSTTPPSGDGCSATHPNWLCARDLT